MEEYKILPVGGDLYECRVVKVEKLLFGKSRYKTVRYFHTFEQAEEFLKKLKEKNK